MEVDLEKELKENPRFEEWLGDISLLDRTQHHNLFRDEETPNVVPEETVRRKPTPVVEWIEANCYEHDSVSQFGGFDFSQGRKAVLDKYQKDLLNHILTPDQKGRMKYRTVVWSQPKKHGKTQIAGWVGAWWASEVEAPNLVLTMASNREQSAGLIFNSAAPTLKSLGSNVPTAATSKPEIRLPNGTIFRAIPNNYAGQAGGNYGLTLWSELWTYTSERDQRLYDELVPVPTKYNSIRWVETYAGFEDESEILMNLFEQIFTDTTEEELQPGVEPVEELKHLTTTNGRPTCYVNKEAGLFYYCDHEIRASWLEGERGTAYLKSQKADLRHAQYIRLWENRWQSSEGGFITPEMWDDSVNLFESKYEPMYLAGDASQRNDHTALVGVQRVPVKVFGEIQYRYRVRYVRTWDPGGKDIDLDETIAKEVLRLWKRGLVLGPFHYDPTQMHQVAMNLRKKGVKCKEFNQNAERIKADTHLWKCFNDRVIDTYPNETLETHVMAAKVKEQENEQIRIIKGKASENRKVDAAVALSMATWKASRTKKKRRRRSTSTSTSMFE